MIFLSAGAAANALSISKKNLRQLTLNDTIPCHSVLNPGPQEPDIIYVQSEVARLAGYIAEHRTPDGCSILDASRVLGVSKCTVWRRIQGGEIEAYQVPIHEGYSPATSPQWARRGSWVITDEAITRHVRSDEVILRHVR